MQRCCVLFAPHVLRSLLLFGRIQETAPIEDDAMTTVPMSTRVTQAPIPVSRVYDRYSTFWTSSSAPSTTNRRCLVLTTADHRLLLCTIPTPLDEFCWGRGVEGPWRLTRIARPLPTVMSLGSFSVSSFPRRVARPPPTTTSRAHKMDCPVALPFPWSSPKSAASGTAWTRCMMLEEGRQEQRREVARRAGRRYEDSA